jgi:hypothetical protein
MMVRAGAPYTRFVHRRRGMGQALGANQIGGSIYQLNLNAAKLQPGFNQAAFDAWWTCTNPPQGGFNSTCPEPTFVMYEGSSPSAVAANLIASGQPLGVYSTASAPVPAASKSQPTVVARTTAQSNAPTPAPVTTPSQPAQSNATNPVSVTPVSVLTPGCFALFGDTSCWGPIGSTTALVLGSGLLGLWFLFGGHK